MLLNVLVATAGGGQTRLGGAIQRGIAIFRQVIRGQCHQGPGAAGSEQSLARLPQNQLSCVVPQTIGGNVFAAVRQGTKGIVANYLARNQIRNLAAEMRRRYAVRLMSRSARFYTGLGNRLAIYSFVGISFGGMVHNQGQRDGCDAVDVVVEGLFKEEPEKKAAYISENLFAADEETELLVVRHPESDVTILKLVEVFEDDFEVIHEDELCLSSLPEVEEFSSHGAEAEVQELISLQTQQSMELQNLFRKLCQDNAVLREIIHCQTIEDDHLRKELGSALKTVNAQREELLTLQKTIQNQNELLQDVLSQLETIQMRPYALKGIEPNPCPSRTPRNMEYADPHASGTVINSEIDMERLRAEGGRVRGLKIHRKKRMKRDKVY